MAEPTGYIETFIAVNSFGIIIIMAKGIWAASKLNERMTGMEKLVNEHVNNLGPQHKALTDHLQAEFPHASCRQEGREITTLAGNFNRFEEKIDRRFDSVDDKILQLIRNEKSGRALDTP